MQEGIKHHLVNIVKILLTVALLIWLMSSGKLNFKELLIFFEQPSLLLTLLVVWVSMVLIGTLRWKLLLMGAGYKLSMFHALRLQLVGLFFNSAMPGAVSGDLIKVVYIIRDNPSKGKSPAMMSIILDRIIGLIGMFLVGLAMMLANLPEIAGNRELWPMFLLTLACLGGAVLLFAGVLVRYSDPSRDPLARLLSLRIPLFPSLKKIYEAFRLYHDRSRYLFYGLGLSILVQCIFFAYFYRLTLLLSSPEADMIKVATIFPIGMLTTAIPLAPGGLGVGHVAFDHLFAIVGLQGGANVFNAYTLGQLALNMLGCIPYLLLKRTAAIAPDQMLEWQNDRA